MEDWSVALLTLPTAVYAALILFLFKEAIEWWRRRRGNRQKVKVYKRVLAYECERNNWFVKCLAEDAARVRRVAKAYTVKKDESGRHRFVLIENDGSLGSSHVLPQVHRANFEKLAVEVGYIDDALASSVIAALDAALELEHLRNSIIDYAAATEDYQSDAFYGAFWEYLTKQLGESHERLAHLYEKCTGKSLEDFRPV